MAASAPVTSQPFTFTLPVGIHSCRFDLEPYPILLRSAFGTSHSSSTKRENALLTVTITNTSRDSANSTETDGQSDSPLTAYGEVGLPPRKVGCYEGTYASLYQTLQQFEKFARLQTVDETSLTYDPFERVPKEYFRVLREESLTSSSSSSTLGISRCLRHLFSCVDTFLASKVKQSTDAVWLCMMDVTLFDVWGRARRQLICEMIGKYFDSEQETTNETTTSTPATPSSNPFITRPPSQPRSFYTLGMDSIETMLSNLRFGLEYTPLIKIKVDDQVEHTRMVLDKVTSVMSSDGDPSWLISVDANASWSSPSKAREFLNVLEPHRNRVAMVEQPYPLYRSCPSYVDDKRPATTRMKVVDGEYVDLPENEVTGWTDILREYSEAGLLIYADESICTTADLDSLRPLFHGVNIKLEKAGGYRGALQLLSSALATGVNTWIGCMVGSTLNATQAAHLLPFTGEHCWGDLDGSLLTQAESDQFEGGMTWTHKETSTSSSDSTSSTATGIIRMVNIGGGGCGVKRKQTTTITQ